MAGLTTQCDHCAVKIKLKNPDYEGKAVECPACGEAFVVRRLAASTGAAAAGRVQKPKSAKPKRKKPAAAAAKNEDIDFPIHDDNVADEDDEILEAEEVLDDEAEADDDDWLSELDSLAPKGPVGANSARSPAPAPVAGRPKKRRATGTRKKRRRSLRDPDGEFPLWLSRLFMIGTGAAAGGLCVIIWATMIARTGLMHPYMAMVVGGLVGTGVRLGASKWDFGWFPAVTAALIALVAIIGGKVYGVNTAKREAVEWQLMEAKYKLALAQHEDYRLHLLAEDIRMMYIEQGSTNQPRLWPPSPRSSESKVAAAYDPEALPKVYGESRWREAQAHWEGKTEDERRELQERIKYDIERLTRMTGPGDARN